MIKYWVVITLLWCVLGSTALNGQDLLWTSNWSADNQMIAVGGNDGILRLYEANSFEILKRDTIGVGILRLRWHPKKLILAVAAADKGTRIINFETGKTVLLAEAEGGRAIAWNHDGEMVAVADYEGVLTIWTKDGLLLQTIKKENTKSYVAVDWHPCKNQIIVLSDRVSVYDMKGNVLQNFEHRAENVLMLCVKWHQSGDFYVIGDYGDYDVPYPSVLQFRKADGTLIESIELSKAEYRNMSWSSDGKYLATASEALRIWSKDGKVLYEGTSSVLLWGVDWRKDGKYIVTAGEQGKVTIWNDKAEFVKALAL